VSDTPRTDACWDDESCNILMHSRQLERELAEAKFDLQFRRDLYALQSKELAEARKQRDTLAEALETVLDEVRNDYMACKDEVKAALAAVKGGEA